MQQSANTLFTVGSSDSHNMAAGQQGGRMLAAKHLGFLEWQGSNALTYTQENIRTK